jgi:hypothetical protein
MASESKVATLVPTKSDGEVARRRPLASNTGHVSSMSGADRAFRGPKGGRQCEYYGLL